MTAIGLELFRIDEAYIGDSHVALVSVTLYLSTVVFTFSTLGVLGPGARHARTRQSTSPPVRGVPLKRNILGRLSAEMVKGGTVSLTAHWLSCVIVSPIFLALRTWSPLARRSICYVAWLVIIHAACRQYERLAEQKNIFLAPSLSFRWLSRGLATAAEPDSEDEQVPATKGESGPCPDTHNRPSSSSSVQCLDVDLAGGNKIEIDVNLRDLARRPYLHTDSEPSTSVLSTKLPSPVFTAMSSTTVCTSVDTATVTSTSVPQADTSRC
ncbi:hypothetical protein K466DRAFT_597095 [Polyporus arcularius HHB13444]|uniref:Transmembrane protein n=1 Tax=Polyporus arcularius HHB13444 TaxID=1314778 RepID=A0A5C3PQU8_9APHY|nr:hypothetical protein K466DRAFT_597095 [Polyporus arcularius HHB13444]